MWRLEEERVPCRFTASGARWGPGPSAEHPHRVEDLYVDTFDRTLLVDGHKAMLEELDPHMVYFMGRSWCHVGKHGGKL